MKYTWLWIAFLSGAFLPIQAGLNARLGRSLANPVWAAATSFLVGLITLAIYIVLTRQEVSWTSIRSAPAYSYLGGILGAFYVTAIVLAFPRIGPALTFGLVVAGQMIISVTLDHFGLFVAQAQPVNIWRILGILMIVGGVILIRKF